MDAVAEMDSSVDILTTFAHPLCATQVWREETYREKQEPQPKPKPQLSRVPQRNSPLGIH